MIDLYVECDRCEGTGYRHLIGPLYLLCKTCGGTGERPRVINRLWQAVRHGAAIREDY